MSLNLTVVQNSSVSYLVYSETVAVLEMGSFVSVVSSAALMQKYDIELYLLTAARSLIVVL